MAAIATVAGTRRATTATVSLRLSGQLLTLTTRGNRSLFTIRLRLAASLGRYPQAYQALIGSKHLAQFQERRREHAFNGGQAPELAADNVDSLFAGRQAAGVSESCLGF